MLFTVEQLELIRRLRTTGISPDQILKAFNELEKVDSPSLNNNNNNKEIIQQNRNIFSPILAQHLTSTSTPSTSPQLSNQSIIKSPSTIDRLTVQTVPVAAQIKQPNEEITVSSTILSASSASSSSSSSSSISTPPPSFPLQPPSTLSLPSLPPLTTTSVFIPAGTSSSPKGFEHQICSSAPRPIRSQRTPMKEITTLDNPNELEEFMKQGEEACILDMKTFIIQYSLRQTTVAMMTGVSQPYISKLLNGNHRELSLRCRKNIYCWYLNCRRHPEKLAAFLADPSTRLETNGDGELVPQRRERYVFRPILIRMLENFFAQTPFPDLSRRVEIATACNHMLQLDKKGIGLMPKEIVSPQVVSNWFANKRKELRRKSSENNPTSIGTNSNSISNQTDCVSISSLSPSLKDDEISPRNLSPENDAPSDLTISSTNIPIISNLSSSATPATPATTTLSPGEIQQNSTLDIFSVAQRLCLNFPQLQQFNSEPNFASNFLKSNPFLQFPFMSQSNVDIGNLYNNSVIKTEQ